MTSKYKDLSDPELITLASKFVEIGVALPTYLHEFLLEKGLYDVVVKPMSGERNNVGTH